MRIRCRGFGAGTLCLRYLCLGVSNTFDVEGLLHTSMSR